MMDNKDLSSGWVDLRSDELYEFTGTGSESELVWMILFCMDEESYQKLIKAVKSNYKHSDWDD